MNRRTLVVLDSRNGEMATLALFSGQLSDVDKQQLVNSMTDERGPHESKMLPSNASDMRVSRMFFKTTGIDGTFLSAPVEEWNSVASFQQAMTTFSNLPCVNNSCNRVARPTI
jgi:hypothetical protein